MCSSNFEWPETIHDKKGMQRRLKKLSEELKSCNCTLIAVSKTKTAELVLKAYDTGQRDFGENKVQDLVAKYEVLPKDIRWHMIGHLQRNKVKFIAPFVHLIHGVDSEKLFLEIDQQAAKSGRTISCLIQIHIAEEASKFGFGSKEVLGFLKSGRLKDYRNIKIQGMMGMATFTNDSDQLRREFRSLKSLFDEVRFNYSQPNAEMRTLSMGMSGDYKIALEEGSNMVRIGTAIFGERNYPQ